MSDITTTPEPSALAMNMASTLGTFLSAQDHIEAARIIDAAGLADLIAERDGLKAEVAWAAQGAEHD